jgi:hypothetical protein
MKLSPIASIQPPLRAGFAVRLLCVSSKITNCGKHLKMLPLLFISAHVLNHRAKAIVWENEKAPRFDELRTLK